MAAFFSKFGLHLLVTVATIYFVFYVHIGSRTLFQHTVRIARTPEARELGSDIVEAVASAKTVVTRKIGHTISGSDSDE
jgi:hypothetical protein